MKVTSQKTTGLNVSFENDFNFPQVGYYYSPKNGTPILGIADDYQDDGAFVWQLKFLIRALLNAFQFTEARFYIEPDGSVSYTL